MALAGFGAFSLLIGTLLGPNETIAGAAVFIVAALLAMRELVTPTVTWPNAVALFLLVIWLIPARGYRLPITLPFNLEPYRIVLGGLFLALIVAAFLGRAKLEVLGFGIPLAILAGTATVSAIMNYEDIGSAAGNPGAFRALSYYLGFLAVFVLVASTIKTHAGMDTVVRGLVLGATVVALSAIYESRSGYNAFDHLADWIPALIREQRTGFLERGGNLRVYASAQHPIALSAALFMTFPLALLPARACEDTAPLAALGRRRGDLRDRSGRDDLADDRDHGHRAPGRRALGARAARAPVLAAPARPPGCDPLRRPRRARRHLQGLLTGGGADGGPHDALGRAGLGPACRCGAGASGLERVAALR